MSGSPPRASEIGQSAKVAHQFTGASFVLAVPDLRRSAAFYAEVLGFEDLKVEAPGWCFMARDALRLHLGECPDALPAAQIGDHSYFGYFYVDNAQSLYDQVVNSGTEVIKPLADEVWGMREFGLRTPDGHRIMIGQRL